MNILPSSNSRLNVEQLAATFVASGWSALDALDHEDVGRVLDRVAQITRTAPWWIASGTIR